MSSAVVTGEPDLSGGKAMEGVKPGQDSDCYQSVLSKSRIIRSRAITCSSLLQT